MGDDSRNTQKRHHLHEDGAWLRIAEDQNVGDDEELLYFLYQGLIFPKEDSLMLRIRMTGAELSSDQMMGLASIAELYGGAYADVTTRANFQIREIAFSDGIKVLRELLKLDILPPTKGLNNLRNVTVTPTSGFDAQEVINVIPLAKSLTESILYQPALQGLPGKFNIAIDSGGSMAVASEANDLGLKAVVRDGKEKFKVSFASLKGKKTVAIDSGWLIDPSQAVQVVSAAISVFLKYGDFSKRLRSRLKYYIESVGIEEFKKQVKENLFFELEEWRGNVEQKRVENSHIGVWSQKQEGYSYIGINGASGRYSVSQLRTLARLAKSKGSGRVRLTIQQNCLLPDIAKSEIHQVIEDIREAGMSPESHFTGSMVACTGSKGCAYSATDTKSHASLLEHYLASRIDLDEPVNIHFTGCQFSCAQTYIGDIGLLGVKKKGEEYYHIFLGGGADKNLSGQKIRDAVSVDKINQEVLGILLAFNNGRLGKESFHDYVLRLGVENFQKYQGGENV